VESDLPRCHSGSGRLTVAGSFPAKEESPSCRSRQAECQTPETNQGETIVSPHCLGQNNSYPPIILPAFHAIFSLVAKQLTSDQVQSRKDRAVRFLEDVQDDPDRAAEVEDEDLESYAERRGFEIVDNPEVRTLKVANSSMNKDELLDYVDQLEAENADLQDQLDAIADIVSPTPADDDTGDDHSDDGDVSDDYLD
jgi:hypothetical protein